jgi:DNA polymerase delta subunit 1
MRLSTSIMGTGKMKSLFEGGHTRWVPIMQTGKPMLDAMMSFMIVKEPCICGKIPVEKGQPPTCTQCRTRVFDVYQEKLKEFQYAEAEQTRLWTQCQRCQKSLMKPNICTACNCPILYRRKKAQLDLEDTYKTLKRFDAFS